MHRIRHRPQDVVVAISMAVVGLPLIAIGFAFVAFLLFPPPVALPQPQAASFARTSHIYASDGSLLASLHAQYNRQPMGLDQIAPTLQQAAVASEDARFYRHSGIDLKSIFRALLAGIIPAPEAYSPIAHPQQAETRRQIVIDRIRGAGTITQEQARQLKTSRPIVTTSKVEVSRFPWFVDAVQRYLLARYGEREVFSGGLEVTTTVDPGMQQQGESVLARTLPNPNDPYASLASVDPRTGYVRALVGGRDYATEKFNIATQGRRQPGSSFKPFVLVAALEKGLTPGTSLPGPSSICLPGWKPDCHVSNFDNEGFGSVSLEPATI